MKPEAVGAIADALMTAQETAARLAPISASTPDFDVPAAYAVLHEIERRRVAQGWRPLGRKIGFTNRTIWPRYGVYQPMWAHVWDRTVHRAADGVATLSLAGLVQPRIEPEVVFGLAGPVPITDDAREVLRCVEWVAAGFEIVQSPFPDWKFTAADCTAAFGLHGALVIGPPMPVTEANRDVLAAALPRFELSLSRGDRVVEQGVGANVLGSPALALAFLAGVLAADRDAAPLEAGELVTTGTVTDAWPVEVGQSWNSDFGMLGVEGLRLRLT